MFVKMGADGTRCVISPIFVGKSVAVFEANMLLCMYDENEEETSRNELPQTSNRHKPNL